MESQNLSPANPPLCETSAVQSQNRGHNQHGILTGFVFNPLLHVIRTIYHMNYTFCYLHVHQIMVDSSFLHQLAVSPHFYDLTIGEAGDDVSVPDGWEPVGDNYCGPALAHLTAKTGASNDLDILKRPNCVTFRTRVVICMYWTWYLDTHTRDFRRMINWLAIGSCLCQWLMQPSW